MHVCTYAAHRPEAQHDASHGLPSRTRTARVEPAACSLQPAEGCPGNAGRGKGTRASLFPPTQERTATQRSKQPPPSPASSRPGRGFTTKAQRPGMLGRTVHVVPGFRCRCVPRRCQQLRARAESVARGDGGRGGGRRSAAVHVPWLWSLCGWSAGMPRLYCRGAKGTRASSFSSTQPITV